MKAGIPGAEALPAIIFDLGGVMVDWDPRYLYRKFFPGDAGALERFFEEVGWFDWNCKLDAGWPVAEAIEELSAHFPHRAGLIQAYSSRYEESLGGQIEPNIRLLGELCQAGYPVYALSNWPYELFQRVRSRYAFLDWFDGMVISGEVGLIKPDPRIFEVTLEKVARPAGECIFVDDSQANIDAARELGFRTVLYLDPGQLQADLRAAGIRL